MVNKYIMTMNFRISNDSSGKQRFSEQEIQQAIQFASASIKISDGGKVPLLIRNKDGAVMGEFLTNH